MVRAGIYYGCDVSMCPINPVNPLNEAKYKTDRLHTVVLMSIALAGRGQCMAVAVFGIK